MRKLRERPLQVYLRPDQDSALRHMAEKQRVSLAELVRQGVDRIIAEAPMEDDPLLDIIGLGSSSGKGDASENLDSYLVQLYTKESEGWHANSLLTPARGPRSRKRTTTTTKRRPKRSRAPVKPTKNS